MATDNNINIINELLKGGGGLTNITLASRLGISTKRSCRLARSLVKKGFLLENKGDTYILFSLNEKEYSFTGSGRIYNRKALRDEFLKLAKEKQISD